MFVGFQPLAIPRTPPNLQTVSELTNHIDHVYPNATVVIQWEQVYILLKTTQQNL